MLGDDGVTKLAVAKVVVTRIAGCVGLLSALAVICETYDSRAAKDRILFWLQAGSLTIPIVSLLGPWPAPRNTQGLWGARGTQTTCTLQGLAFHLGATPLAVWDVFLSISFVLTIKYNWSEEQLRKAIRIAHYFVWPISVFRAGILLFYDLYNPSVMGIYCAVAMAPPDCMESGEPCQRGSERHMVINTYISTFCFVVVIIVSTCCMTMITLHIRQVEHRGARHRFSHIAATLQRRDGENGSSSGAVGSSSNYEDVGTGDDSTSVRGSSRSVLNHGRQQRRNVLRQTSSTNRRRLSRQTATKGVMYSFTLLVTYLPVFGVFYFPHNRAVHLSVSLFSNSYPVYYLLVFLYRREHMKTTYGRWVRNIVVSPASAPAWIWSRVFRCPWRPEQENSDTVRCDGTAAAAAVVRNIALQGAFDINGTEPSRAREPAPSSANNDDSDDDVAFVTGHPVRSNNHLSLDEANDRDNDCSEKNNENMIEETSSEERPSLPTGHHATPLVEEEASHDFKPDAMDHLYDSPVIDDTADSQAEPNTGVSEVDPDTNSDIEEQATDATENFESVVQDSVDQEPE